MVLILVFLVGLAMAGHLEAAKKQRFKFTRITDVAYTVQTKDVGLGFVSLNQTLPDCSARLAIAHCLIRPYTVIPTNMLCNTIDVRE